MNSLRVGPFYGTKLLIVKFKDKIEKQNACREVYVFLEEKFLDKDNKEQQNTVCHTIYQKIKSIYAHAEVIIKFGVVISKFFEKTKNFLPYTSLLKVDAPSIL